MKIEHKVCAGSQLEIEYKADGSGAGTIKGYAATFGNKDRGGDIIVKGAFGNGTDLTDFTKEGMILARHGNETTQPIATVTKAFEDEQGLWLEAEFHSTPLAQEERTIAQERAARGKSVAFSIGYTVNKDGAEYTKDARLLKSIKTWEISLVNVPANPQALAAGVKGQDMKTGIDIKGIFEAEIAEREGDLWYLTSVLIQVMQQIDCAADLAEDQGQQYDTRGMVQQALDEFSARVMNAMIEDDDVRMFGYDVDPGDSGSMAIMAAKLRGLVDGHSYTYAVKALADGAKDIIRRSEARRELRTKEGRMLSGTNAAYLSDLADSLDVHAGKLRDLVDASGDQKPATGGKGRRFDEQEMEMKRRLVEVKLRMSGTLAS